MMEMRYHHSMLDLGAVPSSWRMMGLEGVPPRMLELRPPLKVLVVSPSSLHGVLGCGGAMKRLADAGAQVRMVVLGTFGNSTADLPERGGGKGNPLTDVGCQELEVIEPELPEGLRTLRLLDIMCHFGPKEVFIPSFAEAGLDNHGAALTCMRAVEMYPGTLTINGYEVVSPIVPNVLMNISETIGSKFECITKDADKEAVWGLAEKIVGLNAYRSLGATDGSRFCEAFVRGDLEMMAAEARRAGAIP